MKDIKGYVFYEGGYSVGQKLSNELVKNYPTSWLKIIQEILQILQIIIQIDYKSNLSFLVKS